MLVGVAFLEGIGDRLGRAAAETPAARAGPAEPSGLQSLLAALQHFQQLIETLLSILIRNLIAIWQSLQKIHNLLLLSSSQLQRQRFLGQLIEFGDDGGELNLGRRTEIAGASPATWHPRHRRVSIVRRRGRRSKLKSRPF